MEPTGQLLKETEKYITEKRDTFQHLTILIATILGFSIGLNQGKMVSDEITISWIFQLLTICVGSIYLILESESRYYRQTNGHLKTALFLLKSGKIDTNQLTQKEAQDWVSECLSDMYQKKDNETSRERVFRIFANNIGDITILFYTFFFMSLFILIVKFLG